jgi:hypothetical protein
MKLTKSQQIIILKAKVIKLKDKLKEAQLELADMDNEKPLNSMNLKKGDVIDKNGNLVGNYQIESTEQLFNSTTTTN